MIRRSVILLIAVLLVGADVVVAAPAQAHGAPTAPGSRTYLCYTDGHWTGGDLEPRNPACRAAVAKGGKQPLWDWFGVLRSDGAGRTRGYVPDGKLCSGGESKYAAYDLARADWPVTHLTAGARFTLRHNAWAPHPGEFRVYVTKDGYDPTKPLTWDTLEPKPFSTWRAMTPNGAGEYRWAATLPPGKTGRHLIYTVWERSDSKETFYGCSDVVFDGGKGKVTGFPAAGSATQGNSGNGSNGDGADTEDGAAPPAGTEDSAAGHIPPAPATPSGTSAAPTSSPATGAPAVVDAAAGAEGGTAAGAACRAVVTVQTWPGGYLARVAVLNTGPTRPDWRVGLTVPKGTAVVSGVNAGIAVSGTSLRAEARPENPDLATGEQVSVGFVATGRPPLGSPVTLGGTRCVVVPA